MVERISVITADRRTHAEQAWGISAFCSCRAEVVSGPTSLPFTLQSNCVSWANPSSTSTFPGDFFSGWSSGAETLTYWGCSNTYPPRWCWSHILNGRLVFAWKQWLGMVGAFLVIWSKLFFSWHVLRHGGNLHLRFCRRYFWNPFLMFRCWSFLTDCFVSQLPDSYWLAVR